MSALPGLRGRSFERIPGQSGARSCHGVGRFARLRSPVDGRWCGSARASRARFTQLKMETACANSPSPSPLPQPPLGKTPAVSKPSKSTTSRDVHPQITNRILEPMERAEKWQKPWTFGVPEGQRFVRPVNLDGRAYRGINVPLLWSAGFEPTTWGTFNAWKKIGASVKRGEKGTEIIFAHECGSRGKRSVVHGGAWLLCLQPRPSRECARIGPFRHDKFSSACWRRIHSIA